jgi:GST-like protein
LALISLYKASSSFSPQVKQLGFFYKYSHHKLPYCVSRFQREVNRMLGVIETQLNRHHCHFLMGDQYTIADIATWPWVYAIYETYDDALTNLFGDFDAFPAVKAWYKRCISRPASQRSLEVTPFLK